MYRFGGGCGTQYSQGSSFTGGADTDLLGRGYAVATNTLDTFQTACNPVLSAEAALMTREHFVETYGVPEFTIGDGGSGGAIQQLAIGHNYPGLLDALVAERAVPRRDLDRAGCHRLRPARQLLHDARRRRRSPTSRRRRSTGT